MKKSDIIYLKRRGIDYVTNHTLPVEHAYKLVKLRRAVNDIYEKILKDEDACRESAGIKDIDAFNNELYALRNKARSEKENKRLKEAEAQLKRFDELKKKILEEEVEKLDTVTMPYDAWHALQCENAEKEINGHKVDILSGKAEDILMGILWAAPAEAK